MDVQKDIDKKGYRKGSPYANNSFLKINSNNISMFGVPHDIFGIDNNGNTQFMKPNRTYNFPNASYVFEFPIRKKQLGGDIEGISPEDARQALLDGHIMGNPLTPEQRNYFAEIAGTDEDGNLLDENEGSDEEMKKGGIHIAKNKRGTFTAAATKHGKGVQEFARQVLAHKENYSPEMVKKANFVHNAASWNHKALGGDVGRTNRQIQLNPFPNLKLGGDGRSNVETQFDPFPGLEGPNSGFYGADEFLKKHGFAQEGGEFGYNDVTAYFQMGGSMTPDEWHKYNMSRGFKQFGTPDPNGYKTYFDPKLSHYDSAKNIDKITGSSPLYNYQGHVVGKPSNQNQLSKPIGYTNTPTTLPDGRVIVLKPDGGIQYIQPNPTGTAPFQIPQSNQESVQATPQKKGGSILQDGGEFLNSLIKSAYKDVMKKGGESSPQGMTGPEVLGARKSMFTNYLANNSMYALAKEEANGLLNPGVEMEQGGNYYAQQGTEVADNSEAYWNTLPGYNPQINGAMGNLGMTTNSMPTFGSGYDYTGMVTPPLNNPNEVKGVHTSPASYMMQDYQQASYDRNPMRNPQQQGNNPNWMQKNGAKLANGIIGGLNFAASWLDARNANEYNKILQQRTDADSVFQVNQFGNANRGDYDVNSGVYKPNSYVPVENRGNMKFGGEQDEQYLSDAEIKKLVAKGYKIKYLD